MTPVLFTFGSKTGGPMRAFFTFLLLSFLVSGCSSGGSDSAGPSRSDQFGKVDTSNTIEEQFFIQGVSYIQTREEDGYDVEYTFYIDDGRLNLFKKCAIRDTEAWPPQSAIVAVQSRVNVDQQGVQILEGASDSKQIELASRTVNCDLAIEAGTRMGYDILGDRVALFFESGLNLQMTKNGEIWDSARLLGTWVTNVQAPHQTLQIEAGKVTYLSTCWDKSTGREVEFVAEFPITSPKIYGSQLRVEAQILPATLARCGETVISKGLLDEASPFSVQVRQGRRFDGKIVDVLTVQGASISDGEFVRSP